MMTPSQAENAGFTPEEARQIAAGNYRVDTRWNKQPLVFDWLVPFSNPKEDYHFTTPERREELKRIAYESGDMEAFGEYLHALQDSFSHQKDGVSYGSATGHFRPFETDMGAHVDRTYNRPELADQMAKATYEESRNFFVYRNTNWVYTAPH